MIPNAIRPLTEEDKLANRPYTVGALLSPSKVTDRLWKYSYNTDWIINQYDKDTCGGNSLSLGKSIQEGRQMSGLFTWIMARERTGMKPDDFGVDNRQLAMASKKVGVLPYNDSPYDNTTPRETLTDITKWDVNRLSKKSLPYITGTVVWVEPKDGLDAFDMWCASTEKFEKLYRKPCPAVFGFMWDYDVTSPYLVEPKETGSGHDMVLIGREDENSATALQSYGLSAGNMGEVKISRAIINRWAEAFGMFIIIDATDEEVKWAVENGLKLDNNWLLNILVSFSNALKDLLAQLKAKTYGIFTR